VRVCRKCLNVLVKNAFDPKDGKRQENGRGSNDKSNLLESKCKIKVAAVYYRPNTSIRSKTALLIRHCVRKKRNLEMQREELFSKEVCLKSFSKSESGYRKADEDVIPCQSQSMTRGDETVHTAYVPFKLHADHRLSLGNSSIPNMFLCIYQTSNCEWWPIILPLFFSFTSLTCPEFQTRENKHSQKSGDGDMRLCWTSMFHIRTFHFTQFKLQMVRAVTVSFAFRPDFNYQNLMPNTPSCSPRTC
jgi:hypothetical protein